MNLARLLDSKSSTTNYAIFVFIPINNLKIKIFKWCLLQKHQIPKNKAGERQARHIYE